MTDLPTLPLWQAFILAFVVACLIVGIGSVINGDWGWLIAWPAA